MAHPTRGHRSAAYEIQQLVDVDLSALQITIKHSGTYEPVTYTLKAADTPAARQLLQAIAGSIKIDPAAYRDAGWESSETLKKSVWYGKAMLTVFHSLGYDDFSDARLTVPELRKCYDPLPENTKRSAVHLLARAIKDNHPNGKAIAYALKNTRFPAEEHNPFVYDDATAAAIEHAARGVWLERYTAARDIFARLGYDVSGRAWLTIPAGDLLDWAVTSHPDTVPAASPQPRRADFEKEVAWALNHPGAFGLSRGRPRRIDRPSLARIGQALYPDHVTLTAALILHCLSENSGFNYATLLETSTDSLTHLGERTALQRTIKARNATEDSRATSTSSIYTAGGIIEVLTGLTRFTRAARSHLTAPDGSPHPLVDRLYVEHRTDPTHSEVLGSGRLHNAWRSPVFDRHWPADADGDLVQDRASLNFRALRLIAQGRALKDGLRADVHGHSERTKVHYLAHVLPDHVFNKHAVEAQNSFHDDALSAFTVVADSSDAVAADLANARSDRIMDVEIGLCTNAGQDPDDPSRPCSLGITACFVCPNGYRTVDHIPGLLAAVEVTRVIQDLDPVEWETGEAPLLRHYAQTCLDQFPRLVVKNVDASVDLTPHIHTVTGMYLEMRHG